MTQRTIGLLLQVILFGAACSGQPFRNEAASGGGFPTNGTGLVPSGVKLVALMPAAAPAKTYSFPKAVTKTLDNGLQVFAIPDREQPMVTIRLVLPRAGSVNDPAGIPGVATMTADLLTQGTASRSALQIARAIDFVGGSLRASADNDGAYVAVSVVHKDFALAMDLLSDILIHPAFREDELERRRQQALSNLHVQYSDQSYVADILIERMVYGQHPYGLPGVGTPESLPKIGREEIVHFWQAYFGPEHALLAFAGDITPEAAFEAADQYLGKARWQEHEGTSATPPAPAPTRGMQILLVDKADANQTQIRIGRLGIQRNSPDYLPLLVTNRVFGGGFNSRLSTEIRQKKGLTYGAYSKFRSHLQAGDFSASTFTRTEATVEAATLMVDLIAKMSTGECGSDELNFAREYLSGVFPIQSETCEQVAAQILAVAHYHLPSDYNDTYQQKVMAVEPPEIKEMAGRYFGASDLVLVLVGNIGQFRDALRKEFPKARFEELPFEKVDVLAPGFRRQ